MVDWEKRQDAGATFDAAQPQQYPQYAYPPAYPPAYPHPYWAPILPPHLKPSNNIGWAIGALLTFWPLGIPSIINSLKVDDLWNRGDGPGAKDASDKARRYGIIAVSIAVGLFALWLIFIVVIFGVVLSHS